MRLEAELRQARDLDIADLADAIESIGFKCTRCGACCKGDAEDPHTATVFPDEVRDLAGEDRDWREVARPMPFGLDEGEETFEWALQTDSCGDCTFYDDDGGACTVYGNRPLICQTYPFSVALDGAADPMGEPVDSEGVVRAHECEGLGREISREDAEALARTLRERAVREIEEAIAVRDNYEPTDAEGVVVHDSEGQKRSDGTPIERQD